MGFGIAPADLTPHMGPFGVLAPAALALPLLLLAVGVIVWLLLRAAPHRSVPVRAAVAPTAPADAALVILRERFALGEIGTEEYERIASLLARTS